MTLRIIKYMTGYAIKKRVLFFWWVYIRDNEAYGNITVNRNPPLFFNSKQEAELAVISLNQDS